MQFDPSHKPSRANVPSVIAAAMDKVFYQRRALELNVQFQNVNGLDEWSFADTARRDGFIRRLVTEGKAYAISH